MDTNNTKYLDDFNSELTRYNQKLSQIQSQLSGKTGENFQKIYDSLQEILEEATKAYSQLKNASKEEWEPMKKIANQAIEKVRSSFNDILDTSSDQIKKYTNQVTHYSEEQLKCITEYVSKHPVKSILIAAGLGYFLGKILKKG